MRKEYPPIHIGGFGMPMIDFFAPTKKELADGQKTIELARGITLDKQSPKNIEILTGLKNQGLTNITNAEVARAQFKQFALEWKGTEKKRTLKPEEDIDVARQFDFMVRGATDVLRAAKLINESEPDEKKHRQELAIRGVGGTTTNKLHALQSGLGDQVQTHMLGIVGNEDAYGNRQKLLDELQHVSKIDLQHFTGAEMKKLATGYIIQLKGDRIAYKANMPPLKDILTEAHHRQIEAFVKQQDAFTLEAGDFSNGKLGDAAFAVCEKSIIASGKPIFMGLPTELKLLQNEYWDDKKEIMVSNPDAKTNQERVARLVNAPNTAIIGCNEEEAVTFFCNGETFDPKLHPTFKGHPQIEAALKNAQTMLAAKYATQPKGSPEPICLISLGSEGAYAVTPGQIVFDEVTHVPENKKVNNLGAGDAFFSGATIQYIQHVLQPSLAGEPIENIHSEAFLKQMLHAGQKLGAATIQYKGAELPPAQIASIVHGEVPLKGNLTQPPEIPNQERRRA